VEGRGPHDGLFCRRPGAGWWIIEAGGLAGKGNS
jgi:hypothetical protein